MYISRIFFIDYFLKIILSSGRSDSGSRSQCGSSHYTVAHLKTWQRIFLAVLVYRKIQIQRALGHIGSVRHRERNHDRTALLVIDHGAVGTHILTLD